MQNPNPYTDKLSRWSSHSQISGMLDGLSKGARVLDVGTGSGTLARLCEGRGYFLYGIEPHAEWLGEARSLYTELFSGSLEAAPDSYLDNFAAVVCGDVLEHLAQPEKQLARLVKPQPNDCIFIISVPNIANAWVRANLLFGRFDYADKGILDRTHLHFYTKKTFLTLLRRAGLQVLELRATPIPMELIVPSFAQNPFGKALMALLASITRLWPTLLGYQWIARAVKSSQR